MSSGQPVEGALGDEAPRPWYLGGGAAAAPAPTPDTRPSQTEETDAAAPSAASSAPAVDAAPWAAPAPQDAARPEPVPEPESALEPEPARSWSSPVPDPAPGPSWEAVSVAAASAAAPPPWMAPRPDSPAASSPLQGQLPPGPAAPRSSPAPIGGGATRPGQSRVLLFGALAIVLVLAVGGGVAWLIRGQGTATNTAGAAGSTAIGEPSVVGTQAPQGISQSVATPSPSPSPSPTAVDPLSSEQSALDELGRLRAASLQGLQFDGRWVAQLASKSVGITDPLQTARNGTHTFYAVDILAESGAARATVPSGTSVLVLSSTDFGKYSTAANGQPYWVTLVDGGFASSGAVEAWCAATYPALDPTARDNACAPRTLSPSHS